MKKLLIAILALCIIAVALMATTPKEFDEIPVDESTMTAGELIKELRKYDKDTPVYKVKDWTITDYRGKMPADNLETVGVSEQHSDGYIIILL